MLSPTIDVEVIDKEIEIPKVCTHYSRENLFSQYVDYKSLGDTRLSIDGSRHYKTPFGALPSVTTILSATQGNKASLERWNKKNPGKKEEAARRGTAVHSRMEHYLLGERDFEHEKDEDPEFIKNLVEPFWKGLPEKLDKFRDKSISHGIPICMKQTWNVESQKKYMTIDRLSDIMMRVF